MGLLKRQGPLNPAASKVGKPARSVNGPKKITKAMVDEEIDRLKREGQIKEDGLMKVKLDGVWTSIADTAQIEASLRKRFG